MVMFRQAVGFQGGRYVMKATPTKLMMAEDSKKNTVPEESGKKREAFGGSAYFQGLITEPIAPEKTTKVDGKERDNLTPNLKFGAILSGVVFGLFELFIFANKDLAPPPY